MFFSSPILLASPQILTLSGDRRHEFATLFSKFFQVVNSLNHCLIRLDWQPLQPSLNFMRSGKIFHAVFKLYIEFNFLAWKIICAVLKTSQSKMARKSWNLCLQLWTKTSGCSGPMDTVGSRWGLQQKDKNLQQVSLTCSRSEKLSIFSQILPDCWPNRNSIFRQN